MTQRLPIVWHATPLPMHHRLDLTTMRSFGEIHAVFSGWPTAGLLPKQAAEEVEEWAARSFDPTRDHIVILPTDDPHAALVMGAWLYAVTATATDSIRILRWDRRTEPDGTRSRQGYHVPVTLHL